MCKQDRTVYFCVACGVVLETHKGDIYLTDDIDNLNHTGFRCVGLCREIAVGETIFAAALELCSGCQRAMSPARQAQLIDVVARTHNWAQVATNRSHTRPHRPHRLTRATMHQARFVTITQSLP